MIFTSVYDFLESCYVHITLFLFFKKQGFIELMQYGKTFLIFS